MSNYLVAILALGVTSIEKISPPLLSKFIPVDRQLAQIQRQNRELTENKIYRPRPLVKASDAELRQAVDEMVEPSLVSGKSKILFLRRVHPEEIPKLMSFIPDAKPFRQYRHLAVAIVKGNFRLGLVPAGVDPDTRYKYAGIIINLEDGTPFAGSTSQTREPFRRALATYKYLPLGFEP